MPEVSWTVSGATLAVVFGWVLTGGFQTFRLGRYIKGAEADIAQLRKDLDSTMRQAADLKREADQYHGAHGASLSLQKDQIAEFRLVVTERYATREVVAEVERRMVGVQERLLDSIERLDTRVGQLGADLLKAIGARHTG